MRMHVFFLLLLLLLYGCSGFRFFPSVEQKERFYGKGKVVYVDSGSGFYAIVSKKGRKFYPINLPDDLKKAGKKINFTGTIEKDIVGLEKWGEYILLEHVE